MERMENLSQEEIKRMLAEGMKIKLEIFPYEENGETHYAIDVLQDGYNLIDFTLYEADALASTILKHIIEEKLGFDVESISPGFVPRDDLVRLDKAYDKLMEQSGAKITQLEDELALAHRAVNRQEDLAYNAICYLEDAGMGQDDVCNILGLSRGEYNDIVNKRDIIFDEPAEEPNTSQKSSFDERIADARERSEAQDSGRTMKIKDEYAI